MLEIEIVDERSWLNNLGLEVLSLVLEVRSLPLEAEVMNLVKSKIRIKKFAPEGAFYGCLNNLRSSGMKNWKGILEGRVKNGWN